MSITNNNNNNNNLNFRNLASIIFNPLPLVLLLVLQFEFENFVYCQQTNNQSTIIIPTITTTLKPSTISDKLNGIVTATTTTLAPQTTSGSPETSTAAATTVGEVLLSGNEFVDFTEAPTILFDGLTNESSNDTSVEVNNNKNTNNVTSSPQVPNFDANYKPNIAQVAEANKTTLAIPEINLANNTVASNENTTSNNNNNVKANTTTTINGTNIEEPVVVDAAAGDSDESGDEETLDDSREPNNQAPSFDPPKNVSQYMDYIERLFHDLRHQITDLFEPHIPQLIRTSQMVQLSGSCSYDMLRMALALRQFEPWALRMIDSSGKVPEGIFEGSFTALGSYDECLSTVFASEDGSGGTSSSHQQQDDAEDNSQQHQSSQQNHQQQQQLQPTQGKYCLVNVSPFLPPKPPADRVEIMFQEEANRRNYTKDDQFSRLSPMFYYMKFRIGVCIPSTCVEADMDSISSALSTSLRLNITIPHCRVKLDQPITRHQLVGGLVFAIVLMVVLGATIMDYWRRKMEKRLEKRENLFALNEKSIAAESLLPHALFKQCNFTAKTNTNTIRELNKKVAPTSETLSSSASSLSTASISTASSSCSSSSRSFNRRFRQHWSWMSFSLLTNYKLYFTHKQPPSLITNSSNESRSMTTTTTTPSEQQQQPEESRTIVRCLNGIRVLSLCWVIIANSYITLDPRATKRLTKTRDAPKDFLFQLVAQASLAIETFFFLSGILVSMSFARKLNHSHPSSMDKNSGRNSFPVGDQKQTSGSTSETEVVEEGRPSYLVQWLHFYVHRYVRMTPATMLVIAFTMFAFRYGDGPLWFEATHKAHMSCSENWWRHLLHVANFIDTRQMCFIHYWYIAADMQLFLFAPLLMFLIYQRRRIGYAIATLIGLASMGFVFYTTYIRNLPPTLLFYNSDPESRREFGNTIMTKPLTHALPYMVGMLVGKWLTTNRQLNNNNNPTFNSIPINHKQLGGNRSLATLLGLTATIVALAEVFLPYKWNNSHLPTRFMAALYAALFRFCWSLVLAYLVIACAHPPGRKCRQQQQQQSTSSSSSCSRRFDKSASQQFSTNTHNTSMTNLPYSSSSSSSCGSNEDGKWIPYGQTTQGHHNQHLNSTGNDQTMINGIEGQRLCLCGSGGNLVNRLLSLNIFTHLSKLSFVAYLIHLPLMSVFISQTRGLFAFSHTLVIHLALSYLVMTFIFSFILVHIIEFPFLTFERYLFQKLFYTKYGKSANYDANNSKTSPATTGSNNGNLAEFRLNSEKKVNLDAAALGGQTIRRDCYYYNQQQQQQQVGDNNTNAATKSHGVVSGNQVDGGLRSNNNIDGFGSSHNNNNNNKNDDKMVQQASYRNHIHTTTDNSDETFRISERL